LMILVFYFLFTFISLLNLVLDFLTLNLLFC